MGVEGDGKERWRERPSQETGLGKPVQGQSWGQGHNWTQMAPLLASVFPMTVFWGFASPRVAETSPPC